MTDIEIFTQYLINQPDGRRLSDINTTFRKCSEDKVNNRFLVNSEMMTINFDKLAGWYSPRDKKYASADSLSFSDQAAFLIEFKTGDQTRGNKSKRLIKNVSNKINQSDELLTIMYNKCFDKSDTRLRQNFCLVADSAAMGINPLVETLAALSARDNANSAEKKIFEEILPNLKSGTANPQHYESVQVWYSEIFDTYLEIYEIKSFDLNG